MFFPSFVLTRYGAHCVRNTSRASKYWPLVRQRSSLPLIRWTRAMNDSSHAYSFSTWQVRSSTEHQTGDVQIAATNMLHADITEQSQGKKASLYVRNLKRTTGPVASRSVFLTPSLFHSICTAARSTKTSHPGNQLTGDHLTQTFCRYTLLIPGLFAY